MHQPIEGSSMIFTCGASVSGGLLSSYCFTSIEEREQWKQTDLVDIQKQYDVNYRRTKDSAASWADSLL
jgi:hypothetical protein